MGAASVIPVRVSVNSKAEPLEQVEEEKKSIHVTGFEFRVNESRQWLQRLAGEGSAEARLKQDRESKVAFWKVHTWMLRLRKWRLS
jgi:hypothetical protein